MEAEVRRGRTKAVASKQTGVCRRRSSKTEKNGSFVLSTSSTTSSSTITIMKKELPRAVPTSTNCGWHPNASAATIVATPMGTTNGGHKNIFCLRNDTRGQALLYQLNRMMNGQHAVTTVLSQTGRSSSSPRFLLQKCKTTYAGLCLVLYFFALFCWVVPIEVKAAPQPPGPRGVTIVKADTANAANYNQGDQTLAWAYQNRLRVMDSPRLPESVATCPAGTKVVGGFCWEPLGWSREGTHQQLFRGDMVPSTNSFNCHLSFRIQHTTRSTGGTRAHAVCADQSLQIQYHHSNCMEPGTADNGWTEGDSQFTTTPGGSSAAKASICTPTTHRLLEYDYFPPERYAAACPTGTRFLGFGFGASKQGNQGQFLTPGFCTSGLNEREIKHYYGPAQVTPGGNIWNWFNLNSKKKGGITNEDLCVEGMIGTDFGSVHLACTADPTVERKILMGSRYLKCESTYCQENRGGSWVDTTLLSADVNELTKHNTISGIRYAFQQCPEGYEVVTGSCLSSGVATPLGVAVPQHRAWICPLSNQDIQYMGASATCVKPVQQQWQRVYLSNTERSNPVQRNVPLFFEAELELTLSQLGVDTFLSVGDRTSSGGSTDGTYANRGVGYSSESGEYGGSASSQDTTKTTASLRELAMTLRRALSSVLEKHPRMVSRNSVSRSRHMVVKVRESKQSQAQFPTATSANTTITVAMGIRQVGRAEAAMIDNKYEPRASSYAYTQTYRAEKSVVNNASFVGDAAIGINAATLMQLFSASHPASTGELIPALRYFLDERFGIDFPFVDSIAGPSGGKSSLFITSIKVVTRHLRPQRSFRAAFPLKTTFALATGSSVTSSAGVVSGVTLPGNADEMVAQDFADKAGVDPLKSALDKLTSLRADKYAHLSAVYHPTVTHVSGDAEGASLVVAAPVGIADAVGEQFLYKKAADRETLRTVLHGYYASGGDGAGTQSSAGVAMEEYLAAGPMSTGLGVNVPQAPDARKRLYLEFELTVQCDNSATTFETGIQESLSTFYSAFTFDVTAWDQAKAFQRGEYGNSGSVSAGPAWNAGAPRSLIPGLQYAVATALRMRDQAWLVFEVLPDDVYVIPHNPEAELLTAGERKLTVVIPLDVNPDLPDVDVNNPDPSHWAGPTEQHKEAVKLHKYLSADSGVKALLEREVVEVFKSGNEDTAVVITSATLSKPFQLVVDDAFAETHAIPGSASYGVGNYSGAASETAVGSRAGTVYLSNVKDAQSFKEEVLYGRSPGFGEGGRSAALAGSVFSLEETTSAAYVPAALGSDPARDFSYYGAGPGTDWGGFAFLEFSFRLDAHTSFAQYLTGFSGTLYEESGGLPATNAELEEHIRRGIFEALDEEFELGEIEVTAFRPSSLGVRKGSAREVKVTMHADDRLSLARLERLRAKTCLPVFAEATANSTAVSLVAGDAQWGAAATSSPVTGTAYARSFYGASTSTSASTAAVDAGTAALLG
ncbi:unnamed protein product, partial [Amoebophrya sp. A25]|eukprot:GSA25T00018750001.1